MMVSAMARRKSELVSGGANRRARDAKKSWSNARNVRRARICVERTERFLVENQDWEGWRDTGLLVVFFEWCKTRIEIY
jgi:hypothetical protein